MVGQGPREYLLPDFLVGQDPRIVALEQFLSDQQGGVPGVPVVDPEADAVIAFPPSPADDPPFSSSSP